MLNNVTLVLYSLATGGAEKMAIDLSNEFINNNINVNLFLFSKEMSLMNYLNEKVKVQILNDNFYKLGKISKILSAFSFFLGLFFFFKKNKTDNIVAIGEWPNLIVPFLKLIFPKINTLIVEQNSISFHNEPGKYNLPNYFKILSKYSYSISDKIIAVSKDVKLNLLKVNKDLTKIEVINNPINSDIINKLKNEIIDSYILDFIKNRRVIVNVARLHPQKDHKTLILAINEVLKKLDVVLLIIGDGPEKSKLQELITTLKLNDNIILLGNQSNPYKFMKLAKLYVQSSLFEGFPVVFSESLSLGLPILSTRCDSSVELIKDEKIGRIVNIGDFKSMSISINDMLHYNYDTSYIINYFNELELDIKYTYCKYKNFLI